MQRVAVKAKRLEFYMCLVKRALRKLVTEQNALGLNQIYIYIQVLILSFQDILKKAQLLFPRVMWSEQNVKLNDVEHKLKDQGRQLKKMSLGQALVMMTMIT
nr:uncharacterized protein LOC112801040 isoform X3 [Arachis hypogaea]